MFFIYSSNTGLPVIPILPHKQIHFPLPLSTATSEPSALSSPGSEGLAEINIARDLKPPKIAKKIVTTLSDEEIQAILRTFHPSNPSDARNQTIFMLLLDTGMRIGELINAKIEDVHMNEGFIKVNGKGNRERIVPIGSSGQRILQRYLFRCRPKPANANVDNVFLTSEGYPLSENSVKLTFARLAKRSGVSRLHAHLCRHTFATRFLINGGDVFTLQQILGHSTLEMVRHYVSLASNHVAIQHQRYSPLDRLNLRGY
jgi:integrase/recombinase XerC/integrase/recombinase XerD